MVDRVTQYNFTTASLKLVEGGAPKLSCDQMEDWTTAEAGLFEEGMEKNGKRFNEIWTDFLPWKTVKNLVEYYYMWKTTDRYVQQKRVKAVESEQKLKQVYVPDYSKAGLSLISHLISLILPAENSSKKILHLPGLQFGAFIKNQYLEGEFGILGRQYIQSQIHIQQ